METLTLPPVEYDLFINLESNTELKTGLTERESPGQTILLLAPNHAPWCSHTWVVSSRIDFGLCDVF